MINIKRSDGQILNFSAAMFYRDIPEGIRCEYSLGEIYVVRGLTFEDVERTLKGRFATQVTIEAEWEEQEPAPITKMTPAEIDRYIDGLDATASDEWFDELRADPAFVAWVRERFGEDFSK